MAQTGDALPPDGGDPVLVGRGGVARDMLAVDWAATPLGPPSGWPAPLRSVVRVLLTSRFAMWMAWGPELTMFYNDAYQQATLRGKHPWALGRPFGEVWAEVREAVTPQIRTVLDDGESTWDEDLLLFLERDGWPEETYHTFSYSPLHDEGGSVQGLLCVVAETTERVLAERRMSFLRDLATAMTSARSIEDVAGAARGVLGGRGRDLPFGLVYLLDPAPGQQAARLAAAVGVARDGPAASPTVELGVPAGAWPSPGVPASTTVLPLAADAVPAAPEQCDRVAVVPLSPATTSGDGDGPVGLLVVGLSRHLAFDERYRDFVDLVAGQVTAGVIDARAEERVAGQRLALVHHATAAFSAAATPSEVAEVAVTHVEQLLGPALQCGVFEYDGATRRLSVLVRRPSDGDPRSSGDVLPVDIDSILTRAVRDGHAVWAHEPEPGESPDEQDPSLVELLRARGLTKVVSLPLIAAGRVVGALGVGFAGRGRLDDGERTTLQALAEPCGVALDRARLYRAEHEIAQTLQRSLLPQALPEVARLPIAVRYVPGAVGTSAGGDWYDVVEVDDTHAAVVVGDVVGQGTAAAAVMGQLRTALSGYLLAGHGPGPALDLLDGLVARVPGARASTAICVLVDTVTGHVRWSRAGHLPALLAPADGSRPHLMTDRAGHGPLLGLAHTRSQPRTEGTTTIVPGTSVVLYTDGLVERRRESLDEGLDRLVEVAAACEDRAPEAMASALLAGLAPAEAIDDVAVVVVRLAPAPLEIHLDADPARLGPLRRSVRAWSAEAGIEDDVLADLQLALGEAATNAVEHAYGADPPEGSEVVVRLATRADGGVAVRVRDRGAWRRAALDPGHRGRGLMLIRALASDVVVRGGPDGTTVTFTVPQRRPGVAAEAPGMREVPIEHPARVETGTVGQA